MEDQQVVETYFEKRAAALIKNLEKKGFTASYAKDADEARAQVLDRVPEGSTVVLTGSQTLEQIGVKPYLRDSGKFNILDPYAPGLDPAQGLEIRRQGMTADVLVSSSNAITEDGALVNVDGMGNRVAGMIFGPTKVVLAVGMNKVTVDVPEAFERLSSIAAPMNNLRLEMPNPCVETGFCQDCKGKTRICNYYSIIERSFIPERIHIVLIGQDLGY